MNSLQGHLLIASPQLAGTPFERTVILIVQHDADGAVGFVLNRPISETIGNLWQQLCGEPCEVNLHVNMGGPVAGPLMAVHSQKSLAEMEVPRGIYLAATKEHLEQLVRQKQHPFRIFVGHAGWAKGQLERELAAGVWFTMPATREHVFGEHDDLWTTLVHKIGQAFLRDVLKIKHMPEDPTLN